MNAPLEMAKLLKERENSGAYTPMSGIVEQLPDVMIRIAPKIVLDSSYMSSIIDIKKQDSHGNYIYLNSHVWLLPLSGMPKKYLLIGVETAL